MQCIYPAVLMLLKHFAESLKAFCVDYVIHWKRTCSTVKIHESEM